MIPHIVCLPETASNSYSHSSPHSIRRRLSVTGRDPAWDAVPYSGRHYFAETICFLLPGFRSIEEVNTINSWSCKTRSVLRRGLRINIRKGPKVVVVVAVAIIIIIMTRNFTANAKGGIAVMHCSTYKFALALNSAIPFCGSRKDQEPEHSDQYIRDVSLFSLWSSSINTFLPKCASAANAYCRDVGILRTESVHLHRTYNDIVTD
jgi:hypothetical protein